MCMYVCIYIYIHIVLYISYLMEVNISVSPCYV